MKKVAVLDYGMGNLRSVAQALNRVKQPNQEIVITSEASEIDAADRVVLPGQGSMKDCMLAINQSGLREALLHAIKNKPLFGVCIGEQMLFETSQEGPSTCLGVLPGEVVHFNPELTIQRGLKVPHMGWNRVHQTKSHPLWEGIEDKAWFYFVHSYFVKPSHLDHEFAQTQHGEVFTCAVAQDNIFATQFHPEKSAEDGLKLYSNFLRWYP